MLAVDGDDLLLVAPQCVAGFLLCVSLFLMWGSIRSRGQRMDGWMDGWMLVGLLANRVCMYSPNDHTPRRHATVFHHRALYKWIHKRHHEWKKSMAINTEYAHPIEHLVSQGAAPHHTGCTFLTLLAPPPRHRPF